MNKTKQVTFSYEIGDDQLISVKWERGGSAFSVNDRDGFGEPREIHILTQDLEVLLDSLQNLQMHVLKSNWAKAKGISFND